MTAVAFLAAANYTPTTGRTIDLLVEHDMEYPERLTAAEDVAAYFARPSTKASAHYNIDADSVVQSVRDKDVAWAAPGANHDGLHFEHAGYARQSREEWLDGFGRRMLDRSIGLQIRKAEEYAIPAVRRTPAELVRGLRGVTGHVDVSAAFRRSTHTDPGAGFPWDYMIDGIREGLRPDHSPEMQKTFVALIDGDTGWRVKRLQRLLDALPFVKLAADGVYGDLTVQAVRQFQRRAGIKATGRVGAPTWRALLLAQTSRR